MECKTHECTICKKQFPSLQALGGHNKYQHALHPLPPHLKKPPTPQPDHQQYAEQADPTSPSHPQRPKRSLMSVNYKEVDEEEEEEVTSTPARVHTQTPMSGYTCRPCNQTFGSIPALIAHEANHSDKIRRLNDMAMANNLIFNCEVCDRIFETKRGLGIHRKSHVPRVASTMTNGSIDEPPMENPRIVIDLNEPASVDEGDDEVPNPKE